MCFVLLFRYFSGTKIHLFIPFLLLFSVRFLIFFNFVFLFLFFWYSIIITRQQQRNFQPVVITHDEEFVQNHGRADFVDYYFLINKDDRCLCADRSLK